MVDPLCCTTASCVDPALHDLDGAAVPLVLASGLDWWDLDLEGRAVWDLVQVAGHSGDRRIDVTESCGAP